MGNDRDPFKRRSFPKQRKLKDYPQQVPTLTIKNDLGTTVLVDVAFEDLTASLHVTLSSPCKRSANKKPKNSA
jgi:hypothetical protein